MAEARRDWPQNVQRIDEFQHNIQANEEYSAELQEDANFEEDTDEKSAILNELFDNQYGLLSLPHFSPLAPPKPTAHELQYLTLHSYLERSSHSSNLRKNTFQVHYPSVRLI